MVVGIGDDKAVAGLEGNACRPEGLLACIEDGTDPEGLAVAQDGDFLAREETEGEDGEQDNNRDGSRVVAPAEAARMSHQLLALVPPIHQ